MAALDSLNLSFTPNLTWTASANKTGAAYQPVSNTLTLSTPVISLKNSIANNAVGGSDLVLSQIFTAAASGTASIDLSTFTDVLGRTGGAFVRMKFIFFWLLSVADDASNGTNCSSVAIGNAAANQNTLYMGAATHTTVLNNGDFIAWGTRQAAGKTVDGTHKSVLITNNDGSNAMALLVGIAGGTT